MVDTIANNPTPYTEHDTGSGIGFFLGLLLLLAVIFLALYYGLPAVRGAASPQIYVPGQVDVNIRSTQ